MKQASEWSYVDHYELYKRIKPESLPLYLREHRSDLLDNRRPFAEYMRKKFREKRLLQQDVFLAADISENYGYKLIAEEKHTTNRDVILRVCLAARFNLYEIQEALILYGMAPLYQRLPRDLVFLVAIYNRIYDIHELNELLRKSGQVSMIEDMW